MIRWRRATDVLWRTAPGYLALAAIDGPILEVEGPGEVIWTLLAEVATEADLVASLGARFDGKADAIASDSIQLLHRLEEERFVIRET